MVWESVNCRAFGGGIRVLGLMVLSGWDEARIGEDARRLCMGGKVRTGNGVGTCGRSPQRL